MTIKQLSVFLENKSSHLTKVASILGKSSINISAFSVADTSEFGILRIIVSEPEKALSILKDNGFAVNLTDVVCLRSPNTPGVLAQTLKILSSADVFVEYMYAYSMDKKSSIVVIKPDNIESCIHVFQDHNLELVRSDDLYEL